MPGPQVPPGAAPKPKGALMFRSALALLPLVAISCATFAGVGTAQAQIAETARGIAMGGAVRGDPVGNSALIANPAGMARSYIYAGQGQYVRDSNGINAVGGNVVDSKTNQALAVGAAYHYQWASDDAVSADGHDVRLGFAHAFQPQVFHFGLGLRYLHLDRVAGDVKTEVRDFTLDAGLLYSPSPSVHLGVVGHNLINAEDPSLPRQAGGGIAFTGELVTLDFDALADFESHPDGPKPIVAVGGEMLLGAVIPLRGGYRYDGVTESNWLSGGLGFLDTSRSKEGNQLNVAFRQNLSNTKEWLFAGTLILFI